MAEWTPSEQFDDWQGCIGCALYRRGRCDAYPDRIPLNILSGDVDHMIPRPGQVGTIVFEPMDIEWWRATGERRPASVGSTGAHSTVIPRSGTPVGQAILHIHTTLSDGTATVEEILDDADRRGDIDVVGITDHDDTRAFEQALTWKAAHPTSRVQPIWGVELTIRAFKHLLLFRLEPPFPSAPPQKFLSLAQALGAAKRVGAIVVVPHVNTFWIGLGGRRLEAHADALGLDGFELLNPYHGSARSIAALEALNRRHRLKHGRPLLAIGGSDAHHLEDLYRVVVEFPVQTPADLARAFRDRSAVPRWGASSPAPALRKQLRQHLRALIVHPAEQLQRRIRR